MSRVYVGALVRAAQWVYTAALVALACLLMWCAWIEVLVRWGRL